MNIVKAQIRKDHFSTTIQSGSNNQIMADEPLDVGGMNTGFSPGELLCASLAACITITLRMYADRKQWPLEHADVQVTLLRDTQLNTSSMQSSIRLTGNLTDEQKQRLLEIGDRCSIHKILTHPIHIHTVLEEDNSI
ncbi:OsmC family protein [Cytophagaceae bacterium DM2B3-1]|uniref:OsmC family protein n=1 Tax=Xanthocytophaga flava TaxID=3048013 RepID=A0AAE3U8Y7_9BACT|nr:OsmC family protein [Xanthocytophaga flavus]MDJ1467476.1 OsmC family protein [Xanthocytophaga flavus]MDJ1484514.1 OsmC family protein [Xanthocytophaga flavus]MDJ1498493.1 OsmC family protein [Xanthocytophaga flavus]